MFKSKKANRSPKKSQTTFLKRKQVYDPKTSISREKSVKKRPVTALVDTKWKNPPGVENSNSLNKSTTSKESS